MTTSANIFQKKEVINDISKSYTMQTNVRKEQYKNYDKSKSLSTTPVPKGQINYFTKVVEEPKNNIDLNSKDKDEKEKKLKERLNAS